MIDCRPNTNRSLVDAVGSLGELEGFRFDNGQFVLSHWPPVVSAVGDAQDVAAGAVV